MITYFSYIFPYLFVRSLCDFVCIVIDCIYEKVIYNFKWRRGRIFGAYCRLSFTVVLITIWDYSEYRGPTILAYFYQC